MNNIPKHTQISINNYVLNGTPTGNFLHAVFCNDLVESFCRADKENTEHMKDIVAFIYNYVPRCCYGDNATIKEWIRLHEEEPEKVKQAVLFYQHKLDGLKE